MLDDRSILTDVKNNTISANRISVLSLLAITIMLFFFLLLRITVSFFAFKYIEVCVCLFVCIVPIVIYFIMEKDSTWYRYIVLVFMLLYSFINVAFIWYFFAIIFIIPVFLMSLYYDKRAVFISILAGSLLMVAGLAIYNANTPIIDFSSQMTDVEKALCFLIEICLSYLVLFLFASLLVVYGTSRGLEMLHSAMVYESEKAIYSKEMELNSKIQKGMIPETTPISQFYRLCSFIKPAKDVGGDFYDLFELDDGRLAIVIADVSGKGLPASTFMVCATTLIHSHIISDNDLEKAIFRANNELVEKNPSKFFVTVWAGILDPIDGSMEFINAGHNPPFIVTRNGTEMMRTRPDFVFGRKKNVQFHHYTQTFNPGERLFLYTDGVTESMNPDSSLFGEKRLSVLLTETIDIGTEKVPDAICSSIVEFSCNNENIDDITMVVMDYVGCGHLDEIRVSADSRGHALSLRYLVLKLCHMGFAEDRISALKTACSEIIANISMHGYEDVDEKIFIFSVTQSDGGVVIKFTDYGKPFDPTKYVCEDATLLLNEHRKGGLGIQIVRQICHSMRYERAGETNVLYLEAGMNED